MADLPPLESTNSGANPTYSEMPIPINDDAGLEPSSKDIMIGAAALIFLALVFFFIRNAYVNYLVRSLKRSPNSAGLAGTGLFGALLFGSAIGCAALISKSYLALGVIAPLAGLSFICLMICLVVSFKK